MTFKNCAVHFNHEQFSNQIEYLSKFLQIPELTYIMNNNNENFIYESIKFADKCIIVKKRDQI